MVDVSFFGKKYVVNLIWLLLNFVVQSFILCKKFILVMKLFV